MKQKGFPGSEFWHRSFGAGQSPMPKSTTGFTLVELLVVISIITLLASVIMASLNSARFKARDARRRSDVNQLRSAIILYYDKYDVPPATDGNMRYCLGHGDIGTCWPGSGNYHGSTDLDNKIKEFLTTIPDDPLNNTSCNGDAYMYYSDATGKLIYLHYGMEGPPTDATCSPGIYTGHWEDSCGRTACLLPLDLP